MLPVLLIQTALPQEFQAVASTLQSRSASDGALLYGRIEQQPCCLVRTGIGGPLTERVLVNTLQHIERPQWVLSLGLAGGLIGDAGIGQRRLIEKVKRNGREPNELLASLDCLVPEYQRAMPRAILVSVDRPVLSAEAKQALHLSSGASLCDMETHTVARIALAHGVPWLGARVVSDSAGETLPSWFLALPSLVQRRSWGGVGWQVATHPQDFALLLRLAVRMKTLERQLAQLTVELIRNVVQS